jgi:hypothetical protein
MIQTSSYTIFFGELPAALNTILVILGILIFGIRVDIFLIEAITNMVENVRYCCCCCYYHV